MSDEANDLLYSYKFVIGGIMKLLKYYYYKFNNKFRAYSEVLFKQEKQLIAYKE